MNCRNCRNPGKTDGGKIPENGILNERVEKEERRKVIRSGCAEGRGERGGTLMRWTFIRESARRSPASRGIKRKGAPAETYKITSIGFIVINWPSSPFSPVRSVSAVQLVARTDR